MTLRKNMAAPLAIALSLGIGAAAGTARANLYDYTIDPALSSLSVSGSLTGNPAGPQTAGSLSTSFSGTIVADLAPGSIAFPGGSSINAALQADEQQPDSTDFPSTSAPANYGRTADGPFSSTTDEAIRDLALDMQDDTSGAGISLSGGNFDSGSLVLLLNSGTSDSVYATVGNQIDLSGKGTANGTAGGMSTLTQSGGIETLTLKIDSGAIAYSIEQSADSTLSFTGTLVATRIVPEPASLGLCALAGLDLLRRKRRAL